MQHTNHGQCWQTCTIFGLVWFGPVHMGLFQFSFICQPQGRFGIPGGLAGAIILSPCLSRPLGDPSNPCYTRFLLLILPSSSLPHFLPPATDGKLYRLASLRLALYLLHLLILLLPLLLLLLPVLVSPHCCSVGGAVLSVVPCPITADTCQGEAGCDTGGSQILARHFAQIHQTSAPLLHTVRNISPLLNGSTANEKHSIRCLLAQSPR